MDNNFMNFRLKLIFLALCILILLAIRGHIKLGYAPELEKKSIAVAFEYYGALEKEVEYLVSQLEEAYMELEGIKSIHSVSEPGKGYILCLFSDETSLDKAYVQLSDITANVWTDFPEGVNRPSITRSSRDTSPVYISYFSLEKETEADLIKEAYEAVPGVGAVELGGRKKKELIVELHSGRLADMVMPGEALGSMLRSSNLVRKVAMPGGQTLVLSSRLLSASDFGQVKVSPELKLSDIARLEYKDAESQSMGHIDGQSMLLFFIMKSGEGNTVRLCRELEKVTSQFDGSQLYSLGNKIEKSFIVSSSILLLLFIFLLFGLWFKTRNVNLVAQVTCRSMLSLLAAIAAVTTAGFQVDMTVMAALFFVIVFIFLVGTPKKRAKTNLHLDVVRCQYKNTIGIYTRKDNSILFQTKPNAEELINEVIKAAASKDNTKFERTIGTVSPVLAENAKEHGYDIDGYRHTIDNYSVKHIRNEHGDAEQETARGQIAITDDDIKNIPTVLQNPDYIVYGTKNKLKNDTIVFVKNMEDGTTLYVGEVRKGRKTLAADTLYKMTGTSDAATLKRHPTLYAQNDTSSINIVDVKNEIVNPHTNLLLIAIILSTLIIMLYVPIHFRNLILPFCIALSSGLCASAVCRYFIKECLTPCIRIPFWCFSPVFLFVLFLTSFSPFSPFASDVSFSMEYESDTSFPFIQQSALEVESALLRWNAFARLTLHIDQGRAAFNVLGGNKRDIMAKISELSSLYPEIFFYIPEKHTSHAVDVTVYGNDVPEIENNILQLTKYVNKSTDNVNIIYNFKSDVTNIVLEIPVKCASAGLYPYDVYKALYYTASEPIVDKYFEDDVETDVKVRGDARYRKTLSGLLAVPIRSPFGMTGEAGDHIIVRRESAQGRIYHKNRMRVMSFSVTGISRAKLRKIVSNFPFTGSCHGEVGQ